RRLFVFLSGHGLYEPGWHRLFLAQDFDVNGDRTKNLALDAYQDFFASMPFGEQFLFMDGCLNMPYSPSERGSIPPGLPRIGGYTPDAQNRQLAWYAASIGERATEIAGRGAFLRCLLESLDPDLLATEDVDATLAEAIEIDWATGARRVNLPTLVERWVAPPVTDQANALLPPVSQHPKAFSVYAAAGASGPPPVLRLPDVGVSKLQLDLRPAGADAGVKNIVVSTQP